MDILTATRDFEKWVSGHIDVVKSQFSDKRRPQGKGSGLNQRVRLEDSSSEVVRRRQRAGSRDF